MRLELGERSEQKLLHEFRSGPHRGGSDAVGTGEYLRAMKEKEKIVKLIMKM